MARVYWSCVWSYERISQRGAACVEDVATISPATYFGPAIVVVVVATVVLAWEELLEQPARSTLTARIRIRKSPILIFSVIIVSFLFTDV
jgi:hypothetical protein